MVAINKKQFLFNLRLTQAYCKQQMQFVGKSNAAILRTINPIQDGSAVFVYRLNEYALNPEGADGLLVD